LLKVREGVNLTKTHELDLRTQLPDAQSDRTWLQLHETVHSNGAVLDDQCWQIPEIEAAIHNQSSVT